MKLPASVIRSGRLSVVAALFLVVLVGAARPAATAPTTGCRPGHAGFPGRCVDPIGDVNGMAGPDITRVMQYEWGTILFQVTFAKGPPLAHGATFTDEVSVILTATGTTATKRYRLTVSAADRKHQVLQRLPAGKRMTLPVMGRGVFGRTVTLGINLNGFVGRPYLVRYRVEAARVLLDGTRASTDEVPNTGTTVWQSSNAVG